MRKKEEKQFAKEYNKASDELKQTMISNLFYKWTKDFEQGNKQSIGQLLGIVQSNALTWKRLLGKLKPFSDDMYLTEFSFVQFFYQQIEAINKGLYPQSSIDLYIQRVGYDPKEIRSFEDADRILEIPLATTV